MINFSKTWLGKKQVKNAPNWLAILSFLFLFLGVMESKAKVVYVNNNLVQLSAMDGVAWDTAFTNISPAMAVTTDGDEIWVAAGTYPQKSAIALKSGVALYGGFSGTETNVSQRNWSVNKTILAGAQNASVVKIAQGNGNTRIDGFIVTGGKADQGGGIYCSGGLPVIANNRIVNNLCTGAGVCCASTEALVTNNIIAGNGTNMPTLGVLAGGGIEIYYGSPKIINNLVSGNMGGWYILCQWGTIHN